MKHLILIAIAALFSLGAAAQDRNIAFKDLPQNVKNIIAADLEQNAGNIDTRLEQWLDNPNYTDNKHLLLTRHLTNWDYSLYSDNGSLTIEAIYAGAGVDSVGDDIYGTTVLFKCTTHRGAHSTSSIKGEADLRKKYGCREFSFQAK